MAPPKHITHVYNSFIIWLGTLQRKTPEASSLPRLVLFDWFLAKRGFKLSQEEARLFLEQRYLLEVVS